MIEKEHTLTLNTYQNKAVSTAIYPGQGTVQGLIYTSLGLGEAGEFQNKVKKILRDYNSELTEEMRNDLIDELGDIMWYIANCATELKTTLSDVCQRNIAKLSDRQKRCVLKGSGDKR